ncbi:MAG: hypothetical protein ACXVCY_05040 [Pseudobdellovibrionaceae bacterium]
MKNSQDHVVRALESPDECLNRGANETLITSINLRDELKDAIEVLKMLAQWRDEDREKGLIDW